MAQPRHLDRAPIAEAIIDFRARISVQVDPRAFAELATEVGPLYGPPKGMNLLEFAWRTTPGKKPEGRQIDHGLTGFRYDSEDGKQIAQFHKGGCTFSRLAPYTKWDEVFAEASRLYRVFVQAGQPDEITRIAVRYINRLLLPEAEVGDFRRFLTAPPALPPDVGAALSGFLTRVQVRDPATGIAGTITQTIQRRVGEPGKLPVILDLDVHETGTMSPISETILPRFEALRALKNRYFFASITEVTVDLFK